MTEAYDVEDHLRAGIERLAKAARVDGLESDARTQFLLNFLSANVDALAELWDA